MSRQSTRLRANLTNLILSLSLESEIEDGIIHGNPQKRISLAHVSLYQSVNHACHAIIPNCEDSARGIAIKVSLLLGDKREARS